MVAFLDSLFREEDLVAEGFLVLIVDHSVDVTRVAETIQVGLNQFIACHQGGHCELSGSAMPGGLADLDCDHLTLAAFRVIRQEPLLLPRWQGRGAGARGGGGRWEGIGVAGAWGDRGETGSRGSAGRGA